MDSWAASVLLFFTMLIMLASAFLLMIEGWTSVIFLSLIVTANFISSGSTTMYRNQAYGLDYDTVKAGYNKNDIQRLQANKQNLYLDIENGVRLLENWKRKTGQNKPVAVILNVPGGGLRSAMWTIQSIAEANEISEGSLWNNMLLISGSSGGMIGAAYLREYYWRKQHHETDLHTRDLVADMSEDKLNPVAATAVLNDLFFRFKTFEYDGKTYTRDRALAFEKKLDIDTRGWLNRRLGDYTALEMAAEMPLLILAPTISDDGRKLLISAQPISYLCTINDSTQLNENVEFTRMFEKQGAKNLNFISALRMSATFPYVFPAANLPTDPDIEILDAGIRDNYGMSNTLKFIHFYKEWLKNNTSAIVIIQVRDQEKISGTKSNKKTSLLEAIAQPFGTFYNTILDVQDYQMDDQIRMTQDWYSGKIELVDLVLNRSPSNPISLSWHLTQREKDRIISAIDTDHNQMQFLRLKRLMKESK
ncbi:MAG: patatin-like phospholipase family protein [Flavobacteriales bacterium]